VGRAAHYDPDWRRHGVAPGSAAVALRRKLHQTIHRVTGDIERFHFNTTISAMMELVNAMTEVGDQIEPRDLRVAYSEACETLPKLLAPFAPHLAEEIWQRLGQEESVHLSCWPGWDAEAAREEEITVVVQVNGRLRDRLTVLPDTPEESLKTDALASPRVRPYLEGKSIRQVVVVPNKLVNIVVG
jgi:leucyl-tRNA synthetase